MLTSMAAAADDASQDYFSALSSFDRHDYDNGVKKYYRFLLSSDALLSADLRANDLKAARAHFRSRLARHPDEQRLRLFAVLVDRLADDWRAAESGLAALLVAHPRSQLLWFLQGEFALARQREAEARRAFGRLAKAAPRAPLVTLARALVRARHARPDTPPAVRHAFLLRLAERRQAGFELAEAERLLRLIIAADPWHEDATATLIQVLMEQARYAEAHAMLRSWQAARGRRLLSPLVRGRLGFLTGNFDLVLADLQTAASETPDDPEVIAMLAECRWQCGDPGQALPGFEHLHLGDPANPGFLARYIDCLERTGQTRRAIDHYRSLLASAPDDVYLRVEAASLLYRAGEVARARENFTWLAGFANPYQEYAQKALTWIGAEPDHPSPGDPAATGVVAAIVASDGAPAAGTGTNRSNPASTASPDDMVARLEAMYR